MSLKALQEYTRYSKYARYINDKKRRETWEEQVDRVFEMHERKFKDILPQIQEEFDFAKDMVKRKRVLGSQRALQFGGPAILDKEARLYNCTVSYVDRPRFFQECFWLLLCGCGAGFSVQKHHVARLPKIAPRTKGEKIFVIPDTIEGWSDALGILLASYWQTDKTEFSKEYRGHKIIFDYSLIRPEGSALSWGGKAPGHAGLQAALEKIEGLIEDRLWTGYERLRPVDAYDITMHASDAVLSGGIRRSATICLFSFDDEEMINAKTGNWFVTNPQRGRSNNSAILVRDEITKEQFDRLMKSVQEFGEPGFVWTDDKEGLFNPCVVGETLVTTSEGIRIVNDLVGEQHEAFINGEKVPSTEKGFFYTGHKKTVILDFASGRRLELTPNHKLMTLNGWKEAGDLDTEDLVVLHDHGDKSDLIDENSDEFALGWLLGSFVGDGNNSKGSSQIKAWGDDKEKMRKIAFNYISQLNWLHWNHEESSGSVATYSSIQSKELMKIAEELDCYSDGNKRLSAKAISGSWNRLAGILRGYFDADGSVQYDKKKNCRSIRLWSTQMENLRNVQTALNALGIHSRIYQNRIDEGDRRLPDGHGGLAEYHCQSGHEIVISRESMVRFSKTIGFNDAEKSNKLSDAINSYNRKISANKFVDQVISRKSGSKKAVYDVTIPGPHAFDANGIYAHNCVEIGMWAYWENDGSKEWGESAKNAYEVVEIDGKECLSGWQFCNLCEKNMRKCKTREDFLESCKAAAILGTMQSAYDWFEYLGIVSHKIVAKEALLGVSMTGMMDSPEVAFDPKIQREGARLILKVNEEMAAKIGVNPCARATCVKPAGTTSCILGTSSGVHPHHAKRYIRRVQANKLEFPALLFEQYNPRAVEPSVWSANKTDIVLSFMCEVPDGAKTKNQVDATTLLEHVKLTQQNWVEAGTRKEALAKPWLRHNVSNTCTVKPDEWDKVGSYIYRNRKWFAGISLLPVSGDKDYPQAPFTAIYTPAEIVREYGDGSLMASGLIVDGLRAFDNNLWAACDCALGIGEDLDLSDDERKLNNGKLRAILESKLEKSDWVRRAKQFAERYCKLEDQDVVFSASPEAMLSKEMINKEFQEAKERQQIKRATYLMKDVHNWKLWCDLKREYVDIDWSLVVEEDYDMGEEFGKAGEACSGGACTLMGMYDTSDLERKKLVKA